MIMFNIHIEHETRADDCFLPDMEPAADDLRPQLCTLNHIKGPHVWAVCGLPLREGRGTQKTN